MDQSWTDTEPYHPNRTIQTMYQDISVSLRNDTSHGGTISANPSVSADTADLGICYKTRAQAVLVICLARCVFLLHPHVVIMVCNTVVAFPIKKSVSAVCPKRY